MKDLFNSIRELFASNSVNPLVPNPIYTWRRIMIFTMWVCYLKVGTKPKKFFKNSIFYGFYACIIAVYAKVTRPSVFAGKI